jgi:hypothetical protein
MVWTPLLEGACPFVACDLVVAVGSAITIAFPLLSDAVVRDRTIKKGLPIRVGGLDIVYLVWFRLVKPLFGPHDHIRSHSGA